jgi:hypothetical protein
MINLKHFLSLYFVSIQIIMANQDILEECSDDFNQINKEIVLSYSDNYKLNLNNKFL